MSSRAILKDSDPVLAHWGKELLAHLCPARSLGFAFLSDSITAHFGHQPRPSPSPANPWTVTCLLK